MTAFTSMDLFQRAESQSQSRPGGQNVGVTQVVDRIWLFSFMPYDGYVTRRAGWTDPESLRVESVTYVSGP